MLYEWRTYGFAPGQALAYLDAFGREGLPLVTRHLPMLGYWLTECGRLNVLHHLWVYRDLDDRAACRAALAADAEWTSGFGPRAFPMIEAQDTLFLALRAGSPELDAAVAAARASRPALAPGAPVLADAFACVEIAEAASDVEAGATAVWRTLAGERPGARLALWRGAPALSAALGPRPALRRELMRPCAFSPL